MESMDRRIVTIHQWYRLTTLNLEQNKRVAAGFTQRSIWFNTKISWNSTLTMARNMGEKKIVIMWRVISNKAEYRIMLMSLRK